jgi:hypothetical protein
MTTGAITTAATTIRAAAASSSKSVRDPARRADVMNVVSD